jgi:hypothetical protein
MAIKYIIVLFVETPRKFFTWCFHKQNYYIFLLFYTAEHLILFLVVYPICKLGDSLTLTLKCLCHDLGF